MKSVALVKVNYGKFTENERIWEGQEQEFIELLKNDKDIVGYEFLEGEDFTKVKTLDILGHVRYIQQFNGSCTVSLGRRGVRVAKVVVITFEYNPLTRKFKQLPLYGKDHLTGWQKIKHQKYYDKNNKLDRTEPYLTIDTNRKLFLNPKMYSSFI